jgi:protein Mpv17
MVFRLRTQLLSLQLELDTASDAHACIAIARCICLRPLACTARLHSSQLRNRVLTRFVVVGRVGKSWFFNGYSFRYLHSEHFVQRVAFVRPKFHTGAPSSTDRASSTAVMSAISHPTMFARVWSRYFVALREHPVRTRMVTSGVLYVVGDGVAQFGIDLQGDEPDEKLVWDVSGSSLTSISAWL